MHRGIHSVIKICVPIAGTGSGWRFVCEDWAFLRGSGDPRNMYCGDDEGSLNGTEFSVSPRNEMPMPSLWLGNEGTQ